MHVTNYKSGDKIEARIIALDYENKITLLKCVSVCQHLSNNISFPTKNGLLRNKFMRPFNSYFAFLASFLKRAVACNDTAGHATII